MLNNKEHFSNKDYIELSVNINDDETDEPPDNERQNDTSYSNKEEVTAALLGNNSSEEEFIIYDNETGRQPTSEKRSLVVQVKNLLS
jgi:hypothetical protein